MTVEPIETPRLRLVSTREEDGDFCLSLWLDEVVGCYLADPPREQADEAELNFARGIEADEGWYPFVAVRKADGRRIGTCSLVPTDEAAGVWDLGYTLAQDCWRQGYGTEMVRGMMAFAQARGGRVFTAEVAQANEGSNALLRKLGFRPAAEGSFRKRGTEIVYPSYIYQLTR